MPVEQTPNFKIAGHPYKTLQGDALQYLIIIYIGSKHTRDFVEPQVAVFFGGDIFSYSWYGRKYP